MSKFCETVLSIPEDFVPQRRLGAQNNKSKIPRDCRNLMRTRRRVNQQLSKPISKQRREALVKKRIVIEKSLQSSYRKEAENSEKRAVECIKTNPKYFFSYAKRFSKTRTGIGPLLNSPKTPISDPIKMAEMLSEQYSSVFSKPEFSIRDPLELFPDNSNTIQDELFPSDIVFNESDIVEAIEGLKHNSAALLHQTIFLPISYSSAVIPWPNPCI
eukprot:gene13384-14756_t